MKKLYQKVLILFCIECIIVVSMAACKKDNSRVVEKSQETVTEDKKEEPEAEGKVEGQVEGITEEDMQNACYDMKDYMDVMPEDFGGDLAEILANQLFPDNPEVKLDGSAVRYVIGDGAMRVGASGNGDGYFVMIYRKVDNFTVWGVQIGMTEQEADAILTQQQMVKQEKGDRNNYYIDEKHYVNLYIVDGYVSHIDYAHTLREYKTTHDWKPVE